MPQSEVLATLLAACYRREVSAQKRLYHQWYTFARTKAYPYGRNLSEVGRDRTGCLPKAFYGPS